MGDRCVVRMTLRREDLPKFTPHMGCKVGEEWWDDLDDYDDKAEVVTATVWEANYGLQTEREAAAGAGLPFFGSHDAGGTYGACVFAAVDGKTVEAPFDGQIGHLLLAVTDDLKPVPGAEQALRQYVELEKAVKRLFGLSEQEQSHAD